jgi:hypothetical protein
MYLKPIKKEAKNLAKQKLQAAQKWNRSLVSSIKF